KLLSRRLFATRMERPFQVVLVLTSSTVLRPVEHFLHFVERENRSPGMRARTGRTASARHRRGGDPARQTRRARGRGSCAWLGRRAAETATAGPGQRPRPAQSVTSTTPWAPRSASTIEWLTKG